MSWESTALYYKFLNEGVAQRLGGFHSNPCIIYSMDFAPFEKLTHEGNWGAVADMLTGMAGDLERAGADGIALGSNTAHRVADEVSQSVKVPLLHIADATGSVIQKKGLKTVALLGTRFTMEEDFYKERLETLFDCEVKIPDAHQRKQVHCIIYDELCQGEVREPSREFYLHICEEMAGQGCEAIILGCTEIGMLISQTDLEVPVLDTARLHCDAILEFTLN